MPSLSDPAYSLAKILLPRAVKRRLLRYGQRLSERFWTDTERQLPTAVIDQRHIDHLRVVLSRRHMLSLLPRGGIVAELGVAEGGFSEQILQENAPSRFHLIDTWSSQRYGQGMRRAVAQRFQHELSSGVIELHTGRSTELVHDFADQYFDWIYIDTDHSYETTKSELELYRPKIKPNGLIAGHDFVRGNWDRMVRYGVIEAVLEFCCNWDWEMAFLTIDCRETPSFAIRAMA